MKGRKASKRAKKETTKNFKQPLRGKITGIKYEISLSKDLKQINLKNFGVNPNN